MKKNSYSGALFLVLAALAACGDSASDGGKGTVLLRMTNSTSLMSSLALGLQSLVPSGTCPSGFTCLAPTSFQMKILAAYVVENVDATTQNNVGNVGMVWLNPACDSINDCTPADVDYTDLTDPSAFNTLLNSQAQSVTTGTYRYVRLEFCQGSSTVNNVRVTSGSTTQEFTYGGCGVTSAELASPLELAEGGSITVNVAYELDDGEVYYASGGSCSSATNFCLGGIDLVPSLAE